MMRGLLAWAMDCIYPSSCSHCEELVEGDLAMCERCFIDTKRVSEGFCKICGECFDGEFSENPICPNCYDLDFSFDFAQSALKNTAENRQLVISYKYGKRHYLVRVLARFCAEMITDSPRFSELPMPVLVPVPLHWRRQFSRGFNQSELICKELNRQLEIPMRKLIKRKRYTTTQTRLSRGERLKNLNGAFEICGDLGDFRSIIIVDDVFTTGSTSEECAKKLKREFPKVENIVVVTVLRG